MTFDIATFSVRRWQFTLVAFALLTMLGVSAFLTTPRSEDPHFPIPTMIVRAVLPGAAIRSTFITGFPGETDAEFEELVAFVSEALMKDPDSNIVSGVEKSILEPVIGDSNTERDFARELEATTGVKVYAKLPGWFTIPTPLGTYNPDWAVVFDDEDAERLYFVVETKGSQYKEDVRNTETAKIRCGREHFAAIAVEADPAEYIEGATDFKDVLNSSKRKQGS